MKCKRCVYLILAICLLCEFTSCNMKTSGVQIEAEDVAVPFWGDICVGDNLDECLTNGKIQYQEASAYIAYDWELTSVPANTCFTKTGVEFDNNSIVKKVFLSCANANTYKKSTKDEMKATLNYMMRYFSEHYGQMTKSHFNTNSGDDCSNDSGTIFVWETDVLRIELKDYKCLHDEGVCKSLLAGPCPSEFFNGGDYVDVYIIRK